MKKLIINSIAIISVAVLSFVSVSANTAESTVAPAVKENEVITVANKITKDFEYDKVLEARFLNMLNHNFVYDDDFKTIEDVVNSSVAALLDHRDAEYDDFIPAKYVSSYVYDMYGIEINDFSSINTDFPYMEGYVFIMPRGFSKFEHTVKSVTKNEDGSYSVKTVVSEVYHDSADSSEVCETLFVPNEKSAFGFSIIRSVIGGAELSV